MTEKRFWLVPMDYYGEQRFVRDNTLIGEKSMSNQEVVDLLNKQEEHLNILREELELSYNQNTKLEKENEQLKKENGLLKDTNESLTAQLAHGIEDLMGDSE